MIRHALESDVESICRIYNYYIENSSFTFEENAISQPLMVERIQSAIWFVSELEGIIRGFASATEWKGRSAYRFTREMSVYVEKGFEGRGIASELFTEMIRDLRGKGFHSLVATIAIPNHRSMRFHEKFGFQKKGVLEAIGYKFDRWVDVSYWQLTLNAPRQIPEIKTKRLDLIKIHEAGAEELFLIRSNPEVSLFTRRPLDRVVDDTKRFIEKIDKGILDEEWVYWLIKEKSSGKVVGTICLWHFSEDGKMAEVGYELHPDFWGRGYTTEALYEIVKYAFEELDLTELRAYTNEENRASIRVLEKCDFYKRGYSEEALPDGELENYMIFSKER
jgi:phosphinothricin acetyltransferase